MILIDFIPLPKNVRLCICGIYVEGYDMTREGYCDEDDIMGIRM